MTIIGVDPGFAITGYGIIEYTGNKFRLIDVGAITTGTDMEFSDRLLCINNGLESLIAKYKPDAMAVEELFNTNVKTAIKVGHGRELPFFQQRKWV